MNDAMDHHTRRSAHGESNWSSGETPCLRISNGTQTHRVEFLHNCIQHIKDKAEREIAQLEAEIAKIEQPIANS